MPLSEHEQRQLEQIERGLYTDDQRFGQAAQAPRRVNRQDMVRASLLIVAFSVLGAAAEVMGGAFKYTHAWMGVPQYGPHTAHQALIGALLGLVIGVVVTAASLACALLTGRLTLLRRR